MSGVLRDNVWVNGTLYRAGSSRGDLGEDASAVGDHAWSSDSGSDSVIPAPTGEPPVAGEGAEDKVQAQQAEPKPAGEQGSDQDPVIPPPTGEPPFAGEEANAALEKAADEAVEAPAPVPVQPLEPAAADESPESEQAAPKQGEASADTAGDQGGSDASGAEAPASAETGTEQPTEGGEVVEAPPQSGSGSSREAWVTYAETVGVEVSEDDTRADIIGKVQAAGKAV